MKKKVQLGCLSYKKAPSWTFIVLISLSYIAIGIYFYLKEYAADYSFSQNSIFSLFGPSMVKNFTPFSQKGRPFTC